MCIFGYLPESNYIRSDYKSLTYIYIYIYIYTYIYNYLCVCLQACISNTYNGADTRVNKFNVIMCMQISYYVGTLN